MKLGVSTLEWLPAIITACSVMWIIHIMYDDDSFVGDESSAGGAFRRRYGNSILLRIFGGPIRALGLFFASLPMQRSREKLRLKLIQAGQPGGLNADEFNGARVIALVFLGLAGMFIDNEIDLFPIITVSFCALGVFYPDIWLRDLILKRRRRIFRDLPDFLDTLRLAVDAGLDLSSALKVTVEKGRPGPLMYEMELVERDIALGRTRKEAFRNFADRLGMSEINAFVIALIQADQLGASIGPILKIQADVARTKRWQLAEVLVNKMPMKMLGPLIVFIFPASFVILFTPLIIQYLQTMD